MKAFLLWLLTLLLAVGVIAYFLKSPPDQVRVTTTKSRLTLRVSGTRGKPSREKRLQAFIAITKRIVYIENHSEIEATGQDDDIYLEVPAGTDLNHVEKITTTQFRVDLRVKTEQGWKPATSKLRYASADRGVNDDWALTIKVGEDGAKALVKAAPSPDSVIGLFVDDKLYANRKRGEYFPKDPDKELEFDGLGPPESGRVPPPDHSGYLPPTTLEAIAASIRFPIPAGLQMTMLPLTPSGLGRNYAHKIP